MPKNLYEQGQIPEKKVKVKGRIDKKAKTERPTKTVDTQEGKQISPIIKWGARGVILVLCLAVVAVATISISKKSCGQKCQTNDGPVVTNPLPGGNSGGNENRAELTAEQQTVIGEKIYSGSRKDFKYDPASIKVLSSKVVDNGSDKYLKACIGVVEEGKQVMYAIGFDGITNEADIPTAEIRNKFLTAKDIVKYTHVKEYLKNTEEQDQANQFFQTGMTNPDIYVRVSKTDNSKGFKATMDYVAFEGGLVVEHSVSETNRKYDVDTEEALVLKMIGIERVADQELTK